MSTPIENIPASSIPAARAWILASLQAQIPESSGALVCLDVPGPYEPDEIVAVGEVQQTYSPESVVGSGGPGWLREDYTITVTVDVYHGGDDPAGTFNRARQLADVVVAVVRSDPSLGGAVERARPGTVSHTAGWDEDHKGRHVVIEIAIDCLKTL